MAAKRKRSTESDGETVDEKDSQTPRDKKEIRKEEKVQALAAIQKILNVSEKYANVWNDQLKISGDDEASISKIEKSLNLNYFNGKLKDYQVLGVKWLETLLVNGLNGILADEMGLGKTIQVIALLAHLLGMNSGGRHIIIVPLSTMGNWQLEFKKFAPIFDVVMYQGSQDERYSLRPLISSVKTINSVKISPVLIVPYHFVVSDIRYLSSLKYNYLVIDEAQRIKNHKSDMSKNVRLLNARNTLLLTGTPLQNNLKELWALLNFVMPHIFTKVEIFDALLELQDLKDENFVSDEQVNSSIVISIHKILKPLMLRRMKCDVLKDNVPKKSVLVYCPLTSEQKDLYSTVIKESIKRLDEIGLTINEKSILPAGSKRRRRQSILLDDSTNLFARRSPSLDAKQRTPKLNKSLEKINLSNPVMVFKKIVNHPELLEGEIEDFAQYSVFTTDVINKSGKMKVLDTLLSHLLKGGHKVLIFSTLVIMLNIIEDYLVFRNISYCKLTGRTKSSERQDQIDKFNNNPDIECFLISTRAGGLGLNLTSADTVIFYDRDWNPHVDAQAEARCHRIGQTKPVMIYTLLAKDTIDESIIDRGELKKRLETLIIKNVSLGKWNDSKKQSLRDMLKITENTETVAPNGAVFTEEELTALLDRSSLTCS